MKKCIILLCDVAANTLSLFAWMNQQYYNEHKFMTTFVRILSFLNRFSSVYIIFFLVPSKRYGHRKNNYNFALLFLLLVSHCFHS